MVKAIVYTSNAGHTAAYAALLGEKTGLPVCSLADAKGTLADQTDILYLGWVMASGIKGYQAAAKRYHVCGVCGVCMGSTGSQLAEVRKQNKIPEAMPLFTLQGGFDRSKLHGVYGFMMDTMAKTAGKALAKKTDRTPEEDEMLDMMLHGGNRVSEENLKAVLEWLSPFGDAAPTVGQ